MSHTMAAKEFDGELWIRAADVTAQMAHRNELLAVLQSIVEQVSWPENANHTLGAFVLGANIADARAVIAKATQP
jgi:hypothetical protein